jgi:hypothetical protein
MLSDNGKYVVLHNDAEISLYKKGSTDKLVYSYRESGNHLFKMFVEICGVTWFIGSLNYAVKIYVNCETGEHYMSNEEYYTTWYRIMSKSPDGKYVAVETYTVGGNCNHVNIYDISDLATKGTVIKNLDKVPGVFNIDMCEIKFVGPTSVELSYCNEYTNENVIIGIFEVY